MLTYFQGNYESVVLIALCIISLAIFLISYFYNRTRIINGFLLNVFLFFLIITIGVTAFTTNILILKVLAVFLAVIIVAIMIFGIYGLIIGLLINAKIVMKREQKSLPNLLTLFLGIALIIYVIINMFNIGEFFYPPVRVFLGGVYIIIFYFTFDMFNFLMSSFIYQLNRPRLNQDFIIVLGSGLIGDRVPPLLASRINKAIEFYNKQAKVTNPPKIVFSGGQGPDEKIPEALAMQLYAIDKGIPVENTVLEDKSVNTLQNMQFSKEIMDGIMSKPYKSIFVTNNYHLFRAGIYARLANLKSEGIGAKTALYFLPNAIIREYIAIVSMYKKRYVRVVGFILIVSLIAAIITDICN